MDSREKIIRVWKDAEYRQTLDEEELALLPENPVGLVELTDEDLGVVAGGKPKQTRATVTRNDICCSSGCACLGT